MYTRQRTRNILRDPDAAEPRAPQALAPKAFGRGSGRGQGREGSPVTPGHAKVRPAHNEKSNIVHDIVPDIVYDIE
jgi:hypothetical protein